MTTRQFDYFGAALLGALLGMTACGDSNDQRDTDTSVELDASSGEDVGATNDTEDTSDPQDVDDTEDIVADTRPTSVALEPTIANPAADPLVGTERESCPVYQETRCDGGVSKVCDLYDPATEAFVASPDPLLKRTLLYDRWYDLFGSPSNMTGEREFTEAMPPETPEKVWSDPEKFNGYAGAGDSGIWTGVALNADAFRYAVTGTEADYQRMLGRLRALLLMFDVTGVDGMLSRYHYLSIPEGSAPNDPSIFIRYKGPSPFRTHDLPMKNPEALADRLPPQYFDGVDDGNGGKVKGTPMWNAHLSIDQYTGPMVSFPVVWDLLRPSESALADRMKRHMQCYLNRLQRIEINHLQDNVEVAQALTSYFTGGGTLRLDEDDIDLTKTDSLVVFVSRGMNVNNIDEFDGSCPVGPPTTPVQVLDARSEDFLLEVLTIVGNLNYNTETQGPKNAIDHIYAPTLRGGDASHMIHLGLMVYRMTGDDAYLDFVYDDLIAKLQADKVALTMQAFRAPDWCIFFFGDHITFGTHWQLISMLPKDLPLAKTMRRAMHEEMWEKALHNHDNAKFNVMYASLADETDPIMAARAEAAEAAIATLERFGGGGDVIDSPRRTYNVDRAEVLAAMADEGIGTRCPTEVERSACESGFQVLGIQIPGENISHTCGAGPAECTLETGDCAWALADDALPPQWRKYADFMWQRDPFQIGELNDGGFKQSPGRDLAEPYWMARYYGLRTEGAGQVLVWRTDGTCEQTEPE